MIGFSAELFIRSCLLADLSTDDSSKELTRKSEKRCTDHRPDHASDSRTHPFGCLLYHLSRPDKHIQMTASDRETRSGLARRTIIVYTGFV